MIVGVPKESLAGEKRVALIPAAIAALKKAEPEINVLMESGAGTGAGHPDAAYVEAGAKVADDRDDVFAQADVILRVRTPGANPEAGALDLGRYRPGQVVIGFSDSLTKQKVVERLVERNVTWFALELMPRITRAQSMDALSAMATLEGYKAVLLAATRLPRMFPMMMTAAGTLAPARVFVIGAGVMGLQAIATARRLGAVVLGYDIRPAAKEQVLSLGAKFAELKLEAAEAEDKGGYAKAMDEEFYAKQREMMARWVADSDVVITTAAVPGGRAPVLVSAEMVRGMAPGSLIVDMAAERGGNCELTKPGEELQENGVTVLGPLNVASTVPFHASQMYAKNISTFLLHLIKDGNVQVNLDDEITSGTLVARDGSIVHPRVREVMGLAAPEKQENA